MGVQRFYRTPEWRQVVTKRDLAVQVNLHRRAFDRSLLFTLNQPAIAEGRVFSHDPEVSILADESDPEPFLTEGTRFLFSFRREGWVQDSTAPRWRVRHAGIILDVSDDGATENAVTKFTAYDPLMLLYKRPLREPSGVLPSDLGYTIEGETGRDILVGLLETSETYDGNHYIDTDGTEFGELNQTSVIDEVTFQRGQTLGEAIELLLQTGAFDLYLRPVWRPTASPPVRIVELETYQECGSYRPAAQFGWDRPGRNLTVFDRRVDGTERTNETLFSAGQGGLPAEEVVDTASQARYGVYWEQQQFPRTVSVDAARMLAEHRQLLVSRGRRELSVSPATTRAPYLFNEYDLGDRVPVMASRRARDTLDGQWRVYSVPVVLDDNGEEEVQRLTLSDEGWVAAS